MTGQVRAYARRCGLQAPPWAAHVGVAVALTPLRPLATIRLLTAHASAFTPVVSG